MYKYAAKYGVSYDDFVKHTPKTFDIFLESQTQVEKDNFFLENKRFGTVCAVIAGLFSKKKYKASNFFPIKEKKQEPQTADKMAKILEMWTKTLGGEVIG